MKWQITISYPTSASGIIVLLETPQNTKRLYHFAQTQHICLACYDSYVTMAKPIETLELHYPVIQFRAIPLLEALLILKGTYNPGPRAKGERVTTARCWCAITHRFTG